MDKMMSIQMLTLAVCFWACLEAKSMPFAADLVSPRTKASDFDEVISKLESLAKLNTPPELGSTPAGQLPENREALLTELLTRSGHHEPLSQPPGAWALYGNDTLIRLTLELRLGSDMSSVKPGQPSAMPTKAALRQLENEQHKATLDGNLIANEVRKVSKGDLLATLKDAILRKSKRTSGLMVNLSLAVIRDMLSTQQKMKNARQLWLIGKR